MRNSLWHVVSRFISRLKLFDEIIRWVSKIYNPATTNELRHLNQCSPPSGFEEETQGEKTDWLTVKYDLN